MKRPEKKLVLENGREWRGVGFGAPQSRVCEIIFNTSVVGYQEILSDPSYAGQILVMTYPLIGNYGITDEDSESRGSCLGGLVVRECCDTPSNFRFTRTLEEELEEHDVPCLSGVDTRMITRIIRDEGRMKAVIVDADMPTEEALAMIRAAQPATDLVAQVSCRKRWVTRTPNHVFHVVAVDCGIKSSIIRLLSERGCNVTIVPFSATAEDVLAFHPDGVLLSSGPGSPADVPSVRALFEALKGRVPVFGIGLGAEIAGLSYGAALEPLRAGMHGDHPVRDLLTGRIQVGVINQNYAFRSLEGTPLEATHTVIPDGFIVGFRNVADRVFAVQFQPEAAPGPHDYVHVFDTFISMMEEKNNA